MEIRHDREDYEGRLSDLITAVRDTVARRWKTLAILTALGVIAALALAFSMTPRYEAVARVQIDPSRNPLARSSGPKDDALSPEAIETEVSVINSVDLARRVVAKLKLERDPEFSEGLDASGPMPAEDRSIAVANRVLANLSVGREKLTYIIGIAMKSRDSAKASRIANAFADLYLETKVDSLTGAARNQVDWFRKRLEKLQTEVRASDAQVAQYRAAAGIVGSNSNGGPSSGTIADQQVGPLSSQLATAESDAAAAQSR